MGPKTTMSALYILGVLQTYFFNRNWAFSHGGQVGVSFPRYVSGYLLGYLVNLIALIVLVDRYGLPHQWVQGAMIFVVAMMMFVLLRYWIFPRGQSVAEIDPV
jgi:putative flippase GtrA